MLKRMINMCLVGCVTISLFATKLVFADALNDYLKTTADLNKQAKTEGIITIIIFLAIAIVIGVIVFFVIKKRRRSRET